MENREMENREISIYIEIGNVMDHNKKFNHIKKTIVRYFS